MNRLKTAMLLAALTALLLWAGGALGGRQGLFVALIAAGLMNIVAYWWSDTIALRMHRAQSVTEEEAPELYTIVRSLAQRGKIPMPRIYIIPEETPNAFATGRNPRHAAVAVTSGLMRLLMRDEIEGVLAHELGHVRNRDTLIMTVAATLAGALTMMARFGMMTGGSPSADERGRGNPLLSLIAVLLAPLAAALIQMAISRSREYLADDAGAELTNNPLALADATEDLSRKPADSDAPRLSSHGTPLHLESIVGRGIDHVVQHTPADRTADCEAGSDGSQGIGPRGVLPAC
jgi:heat shock protein HtpX